MQKKLWSLAIPLSLIMFYGCHQKPVKPELRFSAEALRQVRMPSAEMEADEKAEYTELRMKHEFEMLRNPITGTLPKNYHETELQAARSIPSRYRDFNPFLSQISGIQGNQGTQNQNTYNSIGPNNVAGRSRALAFDKQNPKVMLTGGVTGGIFRSADGGSTWNFVSPADDIRSVTCIVQDPAHPNTWYCGTGEVFYPYSSQDIAGTFGWGIFKSVDNGLSWTKLAATQDANQNSFSGGFDVVHRIAVNPLNGDVYAAVHRKIMRSADGGTTWTQVLPTSAGVAATAMDGICDLVAAPDGSKIFAAFSGKNPDPSLEGIWETANGTAWTRIAGGSTLGVDSVAGWQPYKKWSRAVMAISPAKKLYILYKNSNVADSTNKPEADLFQCDFSSGTPSSYTWANLSAWVPNEPNFTYSGINPYTTQFDGFDMSIIVNPLNESMLFIGGTCLHRVNLATTDPALKFRRIGGYGKGFFPDSTYNFIYPNHHPDVHGLYFSPTDNNTLYSASDGGIHKTSSSLLADTVRWINRDTGLQTLQYQFISIIPDTTAAFVIGGAQDNGTYANFNVPTYLDHTQLGGGDGGAAVMSKFYKTGNSWKQYMYFSTVTSGSLTRLYLPWTVSGNNISLGSGYKFDNILPSGVQSGKGQWLTLFTLDPDSTEHLYYNFNNRLFRTTSASTVTSATGWTEITGVASTVPSGSVLTSMAISKRRNGNKYLFFGSNKGKLYRLTNPNTAVATATPDDITPPTMNSESYVAGVSVNPRSPDTIMAVVSNYTSSSGAINHIFWCGNATSATPTWQVLDGALAPTSSQSCAIVLKTSGVEYYVGTSVGLYSATAVNGNSTSWFNEGSGMMKHAIVRSLSYRQADNLLVVGTHGNGAFFADMGGAVTIPDDISTGIDIIQNDKRFIRTVYPTVTNNDVYFKAGTLLLNTIRCSVMGVNGQVVYESHLPYTDGVLHLGGLPSGNYVLVITSDNNKYRQVTKLSKL